jgi:VIT1/CCC1 family predicted Fe2+/Mn2+ transporter
VERFSEIVFGLIMALSFTCAIDVAEAGSAGLRTMLVSAIGCNLAWGIIDAVFYLLACLAEAGRNATLLRYVQQSADATESRRAIANALPEGIAEVLSSSELDGIRDQLLRLPPPPGHPRLTAVHWLGAAGVFLLVFASTFPVAIPFLFIREPALALRISNGVAMVLLFGTGCTLAGYAGLRRLPTGLSMVAVGAMLVVLTIALGG